MDPALLIQGFSAAIAILCLMASGVALLWGRANKADVQRLRESNNDLRGEIQDKDRRLDDLETENVKLHDDVADLQRANERLWDKAQGIAELKLVSVQQQEHETAAAMRSQKMYSQGEEVLKLLRLISEKISGGRRTVEN